MELKPCPFCGATNLARDVNDAIAAWNRRAPTNPPETGSRLVDELRALSLYKIESVSRNGTVCAHREPNGEWVRADELDALIERMGEDLEERKYGT